MTETLSGGRPADSKIGQDGSVEPGQTCPTCARRVPHPRKADTPKSAVVSYRAPVDEVDAHRETLETAARYIGAFERPYWQFWVHTYALAHMLLDAGMQGIAQRQSEWKE